MSDSAFTSDGCSGGMSEFWRQWLGLPPPWEGCCIEHDLVYFNGGTRRQRRKADIKLMCCVASNHGGHPIWAFIMYVGVRVGGSPYWPLKWRWGYGHRYGRRFYEKEKQK